MQTGESLIPYPSFVGVKIAAEKVQP